AVKAGGAKVTEIALPPLSTEHLTRMMSDTLHCPVEDAAALAGLVQEKTGGNPFFVIQFLSSLAEKALLSFDHEQARWSWDVEHIRAQRHTDNVVDLMLEKLTQLP